MDDTTGRTTPTSTPGAAGQLSLVRGSAHLMTAIPHLLGYRPGRSLVVVATAVQAAVPGPVRGRDRIRAQIVMTMRADLTGPHDVAPTVRQLSAPAARLQARHGRDLVLHCYLWDADEELGVLAAEALLALARERRVTLNDLVLVGRDAYLPLVEAGDPRDPRLARPGGRVGPSSGWLPLPSPADVPLVADLVLRGRGVAPGRDEAVAVVRRRDEAASRETERALLELSPEQLDGHGSLATLGRWVCGGSFSGPPTPQERAAAALVLQDRVLRDVVLARWLPRLFTLDDLLEPEAAESLRGLLPPWPQDDGQALARLITVAGQVPLDLSVPLLTLAGLLAWGTGEGTLANEAVDVALEIDPGYRMAQLLKEALERGLAPELGSSPEQDEDPGQGPKDAGPGRGAGSDDRSGAGSDDGSGRGGDDDGRRRVRGRGRAA
ncbi:MAG TPA: DUF4192 family protein [Ornithinimicrobium sp.]|nr:DUF4192 family protein [Ornithinimicrobium sp.]